MIQHTQHKCPTCQGPTLHVRSTYDVPHLGHLIVVAALGLAAVVARNSATSAAAVAAAFVWVLVWGLHTFGNMLAKQEPYRCHHCGTEAK